MNSIEMKFERTNDQTNCIDRMKNEQSALFAHKFFSSITIISNKIQWILLFRSNAASKWQNVIFDDFWFFVGCENSNCQKRTETEIFIDNCKYNCPLFDPVTPINYRPNYQWLLPFPIVTRDAFKRAVHYSHSVDAEVKLHDRAPTSIVASFRCVSHFGGNRKFQRRKKIDFMWRWTQKKEERKKLKAKKCRSEWNEEIAFRTVTLCRISVSVSASFFFLFDSVMVETKWKCHPFWHRL